MAIYVYLCNNKIDYHNTFFKLTLKYLQLVRKAYSIDGRAVLVLPTLE